MWMRDRRGRIMIPQQREPVPIYIKVVMFLLLVGLLLGVLMTECNIPEAGAYGQPSESIRLERRAVNALEDIADSLKKIERKLK